MADIRVLLSEEQIDKRVREVATRINNDYDGQPLHLICVLKGSIFFTCELAKRLNMPVTIDFMQVSSYGSQTVSSGVLKIKKDLEESVEGKNVLIIEDIIDSGNTLYYLKELIANRNPKSLKICTLLDKPERREKDVDVEYVCFDIPDEFVVGYGLDYDQRYRNLPYIGVVENID